MFFVVTNSALSMVKAGDKVISIIGQPRQYITVSEDLLRELPQAGQKQAWLAHTAWTAVDALSKDPARSDYVYLAQLALKLSDQNCTGIYVPEHNMMMPNDGTAEQGLWLMVRGELPLA